MGARRIGPNRQMDAIDHALVLDNMGLAGAVVAKQIADGQDREEMMAEAVLGLCQATIGFNEAQSKFSTYGTYGAFYAANIYAKRQRKHGRLRFNCDAPSGSELEGRPDLRTINPAADASRRQRINTLNATIDRLPAREAAVIRARLNGDTLEAIGRWLNVTKERVRQIEMTARRRLKAMLASEPDGAAP